ncbi:MAG: hypothetical protein V4578_26015 [Pseudomonadota bacterium]
MSCAPLRLTLLMAAAAALLAGCASAPADSAAVAGAEPAPAPVKCRTPAATIGSTIVRKDCTAMGNVTYADPEALQDVKSYARPGH